MYVCFSLVIVVVIDLIGNEVIDQNVIHTSPVDQSRVHQKWMMSMTSHLLAK
jgi:hypothetical protein